MFMKSLLPLIFGAVAGCAMALQGTFNTAGGKVLGVAENTFLVHIIGAVTIGIFLLLGFGKGDWSKIGEMPLYGYLGGVLSAVIIFAVISAMSGLGVGNATAIIILFQIATALAVDTFGLFGGEKMPFSWWRILGVVFLVVGTKLVFRK